ncbi:TolC family protein, partial [bacterium]|nr:TolC family protein [bacterium]
IELALKTNPQVKAVKINSEIAKNEIKSAVRLQNPSIGTFQNMGKTRYGNPQEVGAQYNIELFKRHKRKKLASSNYIASLSSQKISQYDLILDVKKAYIDFLLKKTNLKIIKEEQDLARELYQTSLKSKISEPDLIEAKIALNRSIMRTNTAKTQVIFAQNHFNTIMNTSDINYDTKEEGLNDDYNSLLAINPENNNLNFEQIKEYALNNRADILKAKQLQESAQHNLSVVKSQLIPNLEVEAGWGYETGSTSDTGKFNSGAYLGAMLTDIPLIYRYKPEIKNAKLEIEKAQLNYEDTKIDAIRNITDAWEKYTIARDNLIFYNQELLKDSKSLLEASKKILKDNKSDVTSYLVAKKLYLELILGYQEALADYYISYYELLKELKMPETFI